MQAPNYRFPLARVEHLVTTANGDELMIYDLRHHVLHHLGPVAARVWRACDGETCVPDLVAVTGVDDRVAIDAILRQLADANLIENASLAADQHRQSRRKLLALAGAGAAIVSISAPAAVAAASQIPPGQCWSGNCPEISCGWTGVPWPYEGCKSFDACFDGGGGNSGGCFKWTVNANDPFGGWS